MRDHKSLRAWQEARKVVLAVLRLGMHPSPVAAGLLGQLRRSSLSVQLNIAEGYAYASKGSYRKHLAIAYASAVETGELLELVVTAGLFSEEQIAASLEANRESRWLLLGLLKKLRPERQT